MNAPQLAPAGWAARPGPAAKPTVRAWAAPGSGGRATDA